MADAHLPVTNFVFDMGNVLMRFDGRSFARAFTRSEEDARLLDDALFNRAEWALLDAGAISYDTMKRVAAASLPERLHPALDACFEGWPALSEPLPEVNELAIRLKRQGYGLYLLSNAGLRIEGQLGHMPAAPYLDGRMVSAEERLMKPDVAIYRLFCERFGLDPATCLFIDDNENNCAGARLAGMRACRFTGDAAELAAAIEALEPAAVAPRVARDDSH